MISADNRIDCVWYPVMNATFRQAGMSKSQMAYYIKIASNYDIIKTKDIGKYIYVSKYIETGLLLKERVLCQKVFHPMH